MDVDDLLAELGDLPGSDGRQRSGAAGGVSTASRPVITSQPAQRAQQPPPRAPPPEVNRSNTGVRRNTSGKCEVDDLLGDLGDLGGMPTSSSGGRGRQPTTSTPVGASTSRCISLVIGGSQLPRGRNGGAAGMQHCCDNLRCTKCDFKVVWFHDQGWTSAVDYMFFRNNFPTADKLAPELRRSPTCSAYCCQCSWRNATAGQRVDFGGDLRWVCAGHAL
ncbi:hypothetical protein FOA52_012850 [Chlamydomonas sp. UWO 241]|nr:hypothetical protein FOA52_012850 [Chlamydomonas sp. UWO 241]